MFQKNAEDKRDTHILCSMVFFFENRAIYEIMWKKFVERGRSLVAIWRIRVICWIPKATNIHN